MGIVGKVLEDPELLKLFVVKEGHGTLVEPEAGYDALVQAIRDGRFDDYLEDWAPRANENWYHPMIVLAARTGLIDVVEALLARGADPNRRIIASLEGRTDEELSRRRPLEYAGRHPEMARMLLDAGADIALKSNGLSILYICAGDHPEVVQMLLDAGADPLAIERQSNESPLGAALRLGGRGENVRILREAGKKQIAGKRIGSLACKAGKNPKDTTKTRGIAAFAKYWEPAPRDYAVLFAKASRDDVARAVHALHPGSELRLAPKEPIFDEDRPIFILELSGMPWIIVFEALGEYGPRGALKNAALVLSDKLGCETLGLSKWHGVKCLCGDLLEEHESAWDPEVAYEKLGDVGGDKYEREMELIDDQILNTMNEWFARQGVYLPRAEFESDGLILKLLLRDIKKKQVVGHDVVIAKTMFDAKAG